MRGMFSRPRIAVLSAALLLAALYAVPARPGQPTLAVSERGRGEPTLVLVHGLGLDRSLWDRIAPRLAERHRLVLVDLPGHGASAPLPNVSVSAVAEALDRTLKAQKVKGALLVGHSYGGLVVLSEAASHPDRAGGVVSIDIATYSTLDSERVASVEQLMKERYPVFVSGVFERMTRDSSQIDSVIAKASRVPEPVLTAYFLDAWRTDLRPVMRRVKAPILLTATDATWPSSESWTSARKRLGYETAGPAIGRRIWGSAHLIPIDQPDSLAEAILDFAATLKK